MKCKKCNKEFTIPLGGQPFKHCPKCRKYSREHEEKSRKGFVCKPSKYKNDRLLATMAMIEAYNEKYGTHYTYGQYMAAKEHGWLKHDWSEFEDGNKSDM